MADPAERGLIVISVTGKRRSPFQARDTGLDAGFTLIEVVVAIAVLAILLSIVIINIPNHDERYWRNDLDHLAGSLNAAQDEAALTAQVMLVEIDSRGWRFSQVGDASLLGSIGLPNKVKTSILLPDAYKPHSWSRAMIVESRQFTLGDELFKERFQLEINQDQRKAFLRRDASGRFTWMNG
jgi:prepilin-type N-terminal cleavage/methylation domain-containing protein